MFLYDISSANVLVQQPFPVEAYEYVATCVLIGNSYSYSMISIENCFECSFQCSQTNSFDWATLIIDQDSNTNMDELKISETTQRYILDSILETIVFFRNDE